RHRVVLRNGDRQVAAGECEQVAVQDFAEQRLVTARYFTDDVSADGITRGHRLQAAGAATTTARSAGAHHHVADLAGAASRAVEEPVFNDKPAADAGSNKDGQHGRVAAARAEAVFA